MPRASRCPAWGSAGAGGSGRPPTGLAQVDAFLGGVTMKLWVGVTDPDWFAFLSRADVDEVNFWQPSATAPFVGLEPGAPFLFKLKRPYNHIGGGGTFVKFSTLPLSIAWEVFERKNGAESREAFEAMIRRLRGSANRLWLAARTPLPTVVNPAPSDEPTHDDDYLGEGHPEVYDSPHSLGAPHKLLMSIVPGVSAFHHPTFRCLKRSRLALL